MADGLTVTTHYQKSDVDHIMDYDSVDVVLTLGDRTYAQHYGDHYHERGHDRVQGFVDAIRAIYGSQFPVIRVDVSDIEDYD